MQLADSRSSASADHMKMEDALFKEYLAENGYDMQVFLLRTSRPSIELTLLPPSLISSQMGLLREGTIESELHHESSNEDKKAPF